MVFAGDDIDVICGECGEVVVRDAFYYKCYSCGDCGPVSELPDPSSELVKLANESQ